MRTPAPDPNVARDPVGYPAGARTECRRRRAWRVTWLAIALVAWGGCSVEKNYEILSFFFDGVPAPGAIADELPGAAAERRAAAARGTTRSAHSAYLERRCTDCHGDSVKFGFTSSGFDQLDESVCVECHTDTDTASWVHGPVAAGACLFCHQQHTSPFEWLLRDEPRLLCVRCHDASTQGELSLPTHADPDRACTECHSGHGGEHRYYLEASPDVAAAP